MNITDILAIICLSAGFVCMALSTVGVLRFPDFFTRLHAAGVSETLGLSLMCLGMIFLVGLKILSLKILIIGLFMLLSNPLGTNLIMIAGIRNTDYQGYNKKRPRKKRGGCKQELSTKDEGKGEEE